MLVLGGVLKLFADLCMFVAPLLIDDIVQYVQIKASESDSIRSVGEVCIPYIHFNIVSKLFTLFQEHALLCKNEK